MKHSKAIVRLSSVFIAFSVLMFLYMIPEFKKTVFSAAPLGATSREVQKLWVAGADYASYFQAAYSWYQDGVLTSPAWQWVTNIWPPGMVFLNYFVISIVGLEGKFILVLVCITVAIWSLVFTCGFFQCKSPAQRLVFSFGILVIFLTAPFSAWIASDNFALPTGFALAFALLALIVLGRLEPIFLASKANPSFRDCVLLSLVVGPLLAISALFRVASFFMIYSVVGAAVIMAIWALINRVNYRKRAAKNPNLVVRNRQNSRIAISLLLMSAIPIAATWSWTREVTEKAHPNDFSYTISVPELASYIWRPDEQLIEIGAPWLIDSSANWACRIDKETCQKIVKAEVESPRPWAGAGEYSSSDYERLAIVSALKNPVGYIADRAPKAWRNWSSGNPAQGLLFLIVSMGAIAVAVFRVIRERNLQAFLFLSMIFFATAPMLRILFYFYYFIPIQVGSVFYLLINQEAVRHLLLKLQVLLRKTRKNQQEFVN